MFSIGTPEILLLLLIAFVVFGPKHLPKIARTAGKLIGKWRQAADEMRRAVEDEAGKDDDEAPAPKRPVRRRSSHARRK